jgi:hypothetical protein
VNILYKPVFTNVPSDISERWNLMKTFIEQWHGVKFANIPLSVGKIDLGISVSNGIMKCLHFLIEMKFTQIATSNKRRYSLHDYIFHDKQLCFGYDEGFETFILFKNLYRGKSDPRPTYFGIEKSDLMNDNPQLVRISMSHTLKDFSKKSEITTLTEFFIKELFCDAGKPKIKGFATLVSDNDVSFTVKKLESIFSSNFDMPCAKIFEKNNAVATLQKESYLSNFSILWVRLFEKDASFMKKIDEIFGQENVGWSDNCSRYKL